MPNNPTGFKVTDAAAGLCCADFEDIFIRKDCFLEGGLWLWGVASTGRLGDNTTTSKSSPVQTFAGGTNWIQVSLGFAHSAAIKTDGRLWLWGCGDFGRLGANNLTNRSSPVQTVSGGTDWKSVSLGFCHSAAIKTDGTLWLWGAGGSGRLGDNNDTDRSSPVQTVSGGTDWKQVSLGFTHSAAIKTDGTLWLWGLGSTGRLGDNTILARSSPVQTVSGGTNWRQVSLSLISAAIKTDGTLWLWGCGRCGGLGDDTTTDKSSPVQTISGGTNWRQVSTGGLGGLGSHSAAIKTDGTLWLWGCNEGNLGDNSRLNKSSPVQTISGGTNWRQVSAGGEHSAAIKTDGTLWLWGIGSSGKLGDDTATTRSSPVQTISGGTNWRNVNLGLEHSAVIREDCW